MTNTKHTLGPWHWTYDESHLWLENTKKERVVFTPEGPPNITETANAHLIAAAPDLLLALKYIREHNFALPISTQEIIDSAIAKAEGL